MADKTATLTAIIHDGVSGPAKKITAEINGIGAAATKMGSVLQGIGVGIGIKAFESFEAVIHRIISLIPELINKASEFGEATHLIMRATGATAEEASRFQGIFEYLGISTDNLGMKLGVLAKKITEKPALLKKLGIATKDATGANLDMIAVIENARSALERLGSGAVATSAAVQLFGRAGAMMLPYLELNTSQLRLLKDEMDKLGVTIGESGVQKAKDFSREMNLLGLSITGVANKLMERVAPALISAVDAVASFIQKNGNAIAEFAGNVVNYIVGLTSALVGVTTSTVSFTGQMAALATIADPAQQQIGQLTLELNALDAAHKKSAKSTAGSTSATKAETTAIDRQLESLHKQLAAIDAKEAKQQSLEDQARRTRDLAKAEAELVNAQMGRDPGEIADARQRVSDIVQEQHDSEMRATDDLARAKIKAEEDVLNKKKQAAQAARSSGGGGATGADAQYAATRKAILAHIKDLEVQSAADAKAKREETVRLQRLARLYGETLGPSGLAGNFDQARLAGMKFADDLKTALGGLAKDLKGFGDAFKFLLDVVITPLYHVLADAAWLAGQIGDALAKFNTSIKPAPLGSAGRGPGYVRGGAPSSILGGGVPGPVANARQNLSITLNIAGKEFHPWISKMIADEERRHTGSSGRGPQ